MIISCPHCQTKYQVTYEAIGSAGRKVQCAHCEQAWDQGPIPKDEPPPEVKKAEQAIDEDGLDDAMDSEERAAAALAAAAIAAKTEKEKAAKAEKEKAAKAAKAQKAAEKDSSARGQAAAGKLDPALVRKRRKAFSRGEEEVDDQPLAQLRLAARITGAVLLVGVLAFAYFGRVQIVQRFPAMAGVYSAVGLGINAVGLDFSDVSTLQTLRDGKEVLIVSAQIVGRSSTPVRVPAVVVTLIGADGQGVYQWSVQPSVRDLMIGERSTFDTQLTLPPGDASRVRLSFAGGAGKGITSGKAPPVKAVATPAATTDGIQISVPAAADHGEPAHSAAEAAAETEHGAAAAPENASPEHH
jgi:predicted Zn finger-like uncharacterized protein